MRAKQLTELNDDELQAKLGDLKKELFNLRFSHAIRQLNNPMQLVSCKKDIARVKTILREREIAAEKEAAAKAAKAAKKAGVVEAVVEAKPAKAKTVKVKEADKTPKVKPVEEAVAVPAEEGTPAAETDKIEVGVAAENAAEMKVEDKAEAEAVEAKVKKPAKAKAEAAAEDKVEEAEVKAKKPEAEGEEKPAENG